MNDRLTMRSFGRSLRRAAQLKRYGSKIARSGLQIDRLNLHI